mmetsp:Transcript_37889/g.112537  ORF Transcript_37889/g.112537 Transcript_37889/m.112537 type:complete len:191 (+) Transcript_37889:28-600(+)
MLIGTMADLGTTRFCGNPDGAAKSCGSPGLGMETMAESTLHPRHKSTGSLASASTRSSLSSSGADIAQFNQLDDAPVVASCQDIDDMPPGMSMKRSVSWGTTEVELVTPMTPTSPFSATSPASPLAKDEEVETPSILEKIEQMSENNELRKMRRSCVPRSQTMPASMIFNLGGSQLLMRRQTDGRQSSKD